MWLVDRPNLLDQITGGTLQFSDGTAIEIEKPLPDNGAKSLEIAFAPKTITSLTFKVTKVKQTPCNIGLSEIAVFAAGSPTGKWRIGDERRNLCVKRSTLQRVLPAMMICVVACATANAAEIRSDTARADMPVSSVIDPARKEFFAADTVVRLDIEVDEAGMQALRSTPHPWLDRKIGEGKGPMNLTATPWSH